MWHCWLLINLVDFDIGVSILQLAMAKKWRQGPCSLVVLSACGIDFCCVRGELESAFEMWWDFVNDCVALVCAFFCKAVWCSVILWFWGFATHPVVFICVLWLGWGTCFCWKEGMGREEHSCNLLSFRTCRLVLHFVPEGLKIPLSSNFIQDLLQKQLNNSIPEFLFIQFIFSDRSLWDQEL